MRDMNEVRKRSECTVRPMVQEFDNIKGRLRDIAENVYPMGKRYLDEEVDQTTHSETNGDDSKVLNTSPFEALRKGSAGFLVNLMNPAIKWFHLEPSKWATDGEMDDDGQNSKSEYLERLENFIFDVMSKGGSYRAFKKIFEHLLAFGFACALVREDRRFVAKAECLPVGTYALGVGANGKVNRVNRRFAMTAEELVMEFGNGPNGLKNLPDDVIENWKRGNNGKDGNYIVECLIEPNAKTYAIGTMDVLDYGIPKSMKYRAVYWLRGRNGNANQNTDKKYEGVLAVRGYKYNPIIAPRLDCELGGIYGRGRGHDALNACRALQALMFDELEISSNRAEPPLLASNDLREEGLDLSRGAVTYTNMGEQRSDLVTPILTNPPTSDETRLTAQEFEQRINSIFFLGEFATIDSLKNINSGDKRTAAEINALKAENMLQLGGIVLMLEDELLDPVVNAFVQYCISKGQVKFDGMEQKLTPNQLMPTYVGNLQLAQRTQELNSTENSLNFAMGVAGNGAKLGLANAVNVLDNFDFDRIVRARHRLVGASDLHLKNNSDVAKIRMAREEAQQAQNEQAAQQQEAEIELQRMKAAAQSGRAAESQMKASTMGGDLVASMAGGM